MTMAMIKTVTVVMMNASLNVETEIKMKTKSVMQVLTVEEDVPQTAESLDVEMAE